MAFGRTAALVGLCFSVIACPTSEPTKLVLATTTSVQNSGLLSTLLPAVERDTRIVVLVHAAGSGRALAMLADGTADIVISHAPEAEQRLLADQPGWSYRKFAYNHFVIVGPPADPARIATTSDALEAFRRIVDSQSRFVSRADQSGTHEREENLCIRLGDVQHRNGSSSVARAWLRRCVMRTKRKPTRSVTLQRSGNWNAASRCACCSKVIRV